MTQIYSNPLKFFTSPLSHCLFPRLLPGIFSGVKFNSRKSQVCQGVRNMGMKETLSPGPNFNRPVKDLVYKDIGGVRDNKVYRSIDLI
jgi:hypothetical protein